ncbi:5301_t:CDS:1, partial [Paraglomus brasilianum]
ILTAAEFKELVQAEDNSKPLIVFCTTTTFGDLLQQTDHKTLLVINEHGMLFNKDPPAPAWLPILDPLMTLTFWVESAAGTHVVLSGMAHAKFERMYLRNSMQSWIEFVGPLSKDVFDRLLGLHPFLGKPIIALKVKVVNCVPSP